jgi:hypothetical protein
LNFSVGGVTMKSGRGPGACFSAYGDHCRPSALIDSLFSRLDDVNGVGERRLESAAASAATVALPLSACLRYECNLSTRQVQIL